MAGEPASVAPADLVEKISQEAPRVPEFRFLANAARKLGVRVWLFGGTAAAFGHYAKWDLLRERGDTRFQPNRFDYDYTNIFRSNQDLDIVIDGTPAKAKQLETLLQKKYPHLQGSKSAWEVRLLRSDLGNKEALLDNPDFLNQHSDSNSTGLIEVSDPPPGELRVRDIRQWDSHETKMPTEFLRDLAEGTLHYYHSEGHAATSRAKRGLNPPLLSAIRYLTKLFQYELKPRAEDLARIRAVIAKFDPQTDEYDDYVQRWIEKNGKKLIQNAVNIEYAWDTLESLGLREKLIALRLGNTNEADSLSWWLSKEPLRTLKPSKARSRAQVRTAAQLGLDIVAHETSSFQAYESITRAHTGAPNVLISRAGKEGEYALHGDGFYTRQGRDGARGTGLTIRFKVDPNAREGVDFRWVAEHDFAVFLNKSVLEVIPESLNLSLVDYYTFLAQDTALQGSDRGILEKLRRRIAARVNDATEGEKTEIHRIIETQIEKTKGTPRYYALIRIYLKEPLGINHPRADHWLDESLERERQPDWKYRPLFTRELLEETFIRSLPRGSVRRRNWVVRAVQMHASGFDEEFLAHFSTLAKGQEMLKLYPSLESSLRDWVATEIRSLEGKISIHGGFSLQGFQKLLATPALLAHPKAREWGLKILKARGLNSYAEAVTEAPADPAFFKSLMLGLAGSLPKPVTHAADDTHIYYEIRNEYAPLLVARRVLRDHPQAGREDSDPAIQEAWKAVDRMAPLLLRDVRPSQDMATAYGFSTETISLSEAKRLGLEKPMVKAFQRTLTPHPAASWKPASDQVHHLRALSFLTEAREIPDVISEWVLESAIDPQLKRESARIFLAALPEAYRAASPVVREQIRKALASPEAIKLHGEARLEALRAGLERGIPTSCLIQGLKDAS